jgi:hypothetical protein
MAAPPLTATLTTIHHRRLREVYRSAGWPCQDPLEVELLAAGLIERVRDPLGRETLRVTDAGIALLAQTLQRNRARRDLHEELVERVAREMTRAGRLAWRGLSLRAKLPDSPTADGATVAGAWVIAMPDVFSIRHTTVEAYVEPIVHEIKVRRSDLLGELRNPAKRAAYLQLGGELWYVLREGIAEPDEIPPECGVLIARESASERVLDVARPAPKRAMRLPFPTWMALARATPLDGWRSDDTQLLLGDPALDPPPPPTPDPNPPRR